MSAPPAASALPAPLRPWAELFADMPEPHLRLLAALVRTLAPVIERAQAFGAQPEGAFDSFSGVGTGDAVERLVASEWLWRDLWPDEFLRRVAERDLLTFEPVHRQAADRRTLLVVLDAGPWMLGRPRLVAFAALLCLAAGAVRRGARLLWTSNAFAEAGWREALTRADIAALLGQVSATSLTAEEVERRRAAPVPGPGREGEAASLWIVGPGEVADLAPAEGANLIAVRERPRFEADAFALAAEVVVTTAGGRQAAAAFDLPDEAASAALLRAPFRTRPAPDKEPRPTPLPPGDDWTLRALAFSPGGEYLLVALPDGVLIHPAAPGHGGTPYRLALAPGAHLVGLRVTANSLGTAVVAPSPEGARLAVRVVGLGARASLQSRHFAVALPEGHPLAAPVPRTVLPVLGRPGRSNRPWAYAANGAPFLLAAEGVTPYEPLARARLVAVHQDALLVAKGPGTILARERDDARTLARFDLSAHPAERLTPPNLLLQRPHKLLAVQVEPGSWHVHRPDAPAAAARFRTGGGETALAFARRYQEGPIEAVVLREDGGVHRQGEDGRDMGRVAALPCPLPDLVRITAGVAQGSVLAAARLDAGGFAASFSLHAYWSRQGSGWGNGLEVRALAEAATCLPG